MGNEVLTMINEVKSNWKDRVFMDYQIFMNDIIDADVVQIERVHVEP